MRLQESVATAGDTGVGWTNVLVAAEVMVVFGGGDGEGDAGDGGGGGDNGGEDGVGGSVDMMVGEVMEVMVMEEVEVWL